MDRDQYLTALGIQQWRERSAAVPDSATTVADDDDWNVLEKTATACVLCDLCKTRKNVVFGSGNRHAQLMVIGEAPGATEDEEGLPFVGAAGQLLTKMLLAIQLPREQVYIANILKCRPPNNRDPKPDEVATCTPYLQRQIALIQPKLILALGRIAAQYLLKTTQSLASLRGTVHDYQGTPLQVTYHPAYLLRTPQDKRKAWEDLQQVQQFLVATRNDTTHSS